MIKDQNIAIDGLAIIERYESFRDYLYPILQRAPRRHGMARDAALGTLFAAIGLIHHASKSKQLSRLHAVDAEFATMRSHLRFLARSNVRVITVRQHRTALALLAEPGGMLGAWAKRLGGQSGK